MTLLGLAESRAREKGIAHLALDTAEPATDLIELYQSKGYRLVDRLQWPDTNYRSVVLSKSFQDCP